MTQTPSKELKIENTSVASLRPYDRNARTHSKLQIRQIAASIKEFGFTNPVLIDSEGMIIAGHGRAEAAKLLGMAQVPTIRLENLSRDQICAYVLADICEEVVEIVRDRLFSPNVFSVLRKMKPAIQIATAELMRMREDFTVSFAKTRLALTPPDLLVDQPNGRKIKKDALAANAMLQEDTELLVRTLKSIEESYGSDVLTLTVCCTYIETLLGNHNVTRYLQKHHAGTFAALHSAIKNAKAGS
jgi:hypothetical protein